MSLPGELALAALTPRRSCSSPSPGPEAADEAPSAETGAETGAEAREEVFGREAVG